MNDDFNERRGQSCDETGGFSARGAQNSKKYVVRNAPVRKSGTSDGKNQNTSQNTNASQNPYQGAGRKSGGVKDGITSGVNNLIDSVKKAFGKMGAFFKNCAKAIVSPKNKKIRLIAMISAASVVVVVCAAFGISSLVKSGVFCSHDYQENVIVQANCEHGGEIEYTCTKCGKSYTEEKPQTEHKIIIDKAQEANCYQEGKTEGKHCALCGKIFTAQKITPIKHASLVIDEAVEATCDTPGYTEGSHCDYCNTVVEPQETIDARGHRYTKDDNLLQVKCLRCNQIAFGFANDTLSELYAGTYPQTRVTNERLLNVLNSYVTAPSYGSDRGWTRYNYYSNGVIDNYMWYYDLRYGGAYYRAVYFTKYIPTMCTDEASETKGQQKENGYEKGTIYWFKYEPIKWKVLSFGGENATLMSSVVLDSQPFDYAEGPIYSNNYYNSSIRAWLNNTFLSSIKGSFSFSNIRYYDVAKDMEIPSDNLMADRIFLLSGKEAETFGIGKSTIGDCSDYALSQGFWRGYKNGNPLFWLRSPSADGSDKYTAQVISFNEAEPEDEFVWQPRIGVVPSMVIDVHAFYNDI